MSHEAKLVIKILFFLRNIILEKINQLSTKPCFHNNNKTVRFVSNVLCRYFSVRLSFEFEFLRASEQVVFVMIVLL